MSRGQKRPIREVTTEDMMITGGQKRPTREGTRGDLMIIGGQKRPMTEMITGGQKRPVIEMITGGQKRPTSTSPENMKREKEEEMMKEREQEALAPEEGDMRGTVAQIMSMRGEEEEEEGASLLRKDKGRDILATKDEMDAQGP